MGRLRKDFMPSLRFFPDASVVFLALNLLIAGRVEDDWMTTATGMVLGSLGLSLLCLELTRRQED